MLAANWPYTHPAARQPGVSLPLRRLGSPRQFLSLPATAFLCLTFAVWRVARRPYIFSPARSATSMAPSFFAFPVMRRGVSYLFLCRLSGRNISRADAAAAGLVEGDHHDIKCTIGCCSDLHVHGSGMQQDRTDRNTAGTRARYCRDSSTCRNRGYDSACGDHCIHHSLRRSGTA